MDVAVGAELEGVGLDDPASEVGQVAEVAVVDVVG